MNSRLVVAVLTISACAHTPQPNHQTPQQLLVVLTEGWSSPLGTSTLYEREGGGWRVVTASPVVVGKNGLGWGLGIGPALPRGSDEPVKKEGDGKAPAGVFQIGAAFGVAAPGGSWPFRTLKATTECVDDTASTHYNQTLENDTVAVDWKSSEKMASEALYRLGAFVEHNTSATQVGAGSCIFMHVWREQGRGTAGCTAFDEAALRGVLTSLRSEAHPQLIQLPSAVYEAHRGARGWP